MYEGTIFFFALGLNYKGFSVNRFNKRFVRKNCIPTVTDNCRACHQLTSLAFTTLWGYPADDKLMIFFLFFPPRKLDLTFHAYCLHLRRFA